MASKKILVVGDYCRLDILSFFEDIKKEYEILFTYYSYPEEITNQTYKETGKAIFCCNFLSARSLLKKIQPEKVLFFDLDMYNHIAILASCKESGIRTYHLEHGFRNMEILRYILSVGQSRQRKHSDKPSVTLRDRLRNKLFFKMTAIFSKYRSILLQFEKVRKTSSVLDSQKFLGKKRLIPDRFVSFSSKVFAFQRELLSLPENVSVQYTGFLYSDKYLLRRSVNADSKKIIFIDAYYQQSGLFGVDAAHITKFYSNFKETCEECGYDLYVKKHPNDQTDLIEKTGVALISEEELINTLSEFPIVAGDYSTLFLILLGNTGVVGLSFNMFPVKGINPVGFLRPYEITEQINSFHELKILLQDRVRIRERAEAHEKHRQKYICDLLFRMDGCARKRFTDAITKEV